MMGKKHLIALSLVLALSGAWAKVYAMDQIIRPSQSVRGVGMGGLRTTTGFYEENFYSNPARVCENPTWKFSIADLSLETTPTTLSNVSSLTGHGSQLLNKVAPTAGSNNHARIQTAMPGLYVPQVLGGRFSYGLALLASFQADVNLNRYFSVDPLAVVDVGPALTMGYEVLENRTLAIGVTSHLTYRMSTRPDFTLISVIQGASLSPLRSGGDGAELDFDPGLYYKIHWVPLGWHLATGASVNNVMGGRYSNLGLHILDTPNRPLKQPRALNGGIVADRNQHAWIFSDFLVALELNDIGNNANGSVFRLVHIGSEAAWRALRFRGGLNQGYWTAGVGFRRSFLELDLATYGEEMSLNVGQYQDRRYALRVALQI